jgi:hypothetical protein
MSALQGKMLGGHGLFARLGCEAATKVLHAHLVSAPNLLRRFEREARGFSSLDHWSLLPDVKPANMPLIGTDFHIGNQINGRWTTHGCFAILRPR